MRINIRIVSILLLIFLIHYSYGKERNVTVISKDSIKNHKYRVIEFYKWGMPGFGYPDIYLACEDSLQHKYGFVYSFKAGCVPSYKQVKIWTRHNNKCERRMIRRHGSEWRMKYRMEFDKCRNKT